MRQENMSRRQYHQAASRILTEAERKLQEHAPATLPSKFPSFLVGEHLYQQEAEKAVRYQEGSIERQKEAIRLGIKGETVTDLRELTLRVNSALDLAAKSQSSIDIVNKGDVLFDKIKKSR